MSTTFSPYSITFEHAPVGVTFIFVNAENFGRFVKTDASTYKRVADGAEFNIATTTAWNRLGYGNRLVRVQMAVAPVYPHHTLILKSIYHGDDPAELLVIQERAENEDALVATVWANLTRYVAVTRDNNMLLSAQVVYVASSDLDLEHLVKAVEGARTQEAIRLSGLGVPGDEITHMMPRLYVAGESKHHQMTLQDLAEWAEVAPA